MTLDPKIQDHPSEIKHSHSLDCRLGLLNATAINMSNLVGTGPFITLPLMISAMGGPQALLGWLAGAVIAIADGMVWSELAAALPGSGGSYIYLRDSFNRNTWGRLCGLSALAGLFDLADVITALLTARILVQFCGQIAALEFLRRFRRDVARPFRMWLYPLPSAVAFFGWMVIFLNSGARYIAYGIATMLLGVVAYFIMARRGRFWPFQS